MPNVANSTLTCAMAVVHSPRRQDGVITRGSRKGNERVDFALAPADRGSVVLGVVAQVPSRACLTTPRQPEARAHDKEAKRRQRLGTGWDF
jgi:hypothetical protein